MLLKASNVEGSAEHLATKIEHELETRASRDQKPLAEVRVLDLTSMLAGPYCSRWLSDLGAEVIKIESLDGDYMRTTAPTREGRSAYFAQLHSGKQSIAI